MTKIKPKNRISYKLELRLAQFISYILRVRIGLTPARKQSTQKRKLETKVTEKSQLTPEANCSSS